MRKLYAVIVLWLVPLVALCSQSRPDTLQGRLTTDSAVALSDAEVIVTRGPDRTVFRTRTDAAGRWRVVADPGTGDYLVFASAVGRVSQRKRVTRTATETSFTVDLSLASSTVQQLARVEVRATKREAPDRQYAGEPARGSAESEWDGVYAAVSPSLTGSASALAATIVGLQTGPGGISALGLPGSQTQFTINGMAGGAELPRGMVGQVRASTTAWDVARGGFSGAQIDANISTGYPYKYRTASIVVDNPLLQSTDAVGRALGQRSSLIDANLTAIGPIDRQDRFAYSVGARVRRREADQPSLASASSVALEAAGVGRDTVARLLSELTRRGIPIGGANGTQRTDIQLAARIDRLGYDQEANTPIPRTYGVVGILNAGIDRGTGIGPTVTPATSGSGHDVLGTVQLVHNLRTARWLHDTKTSLSIRDAVATPALLLPSGGVRTVGSNAETGGVASLGFGGGGALARDQTRLTWETTQESQTYVTAGTRHRVKLFAQARLESAAERSNPNALGAFSYNSLDDLAGGRPSSYSRTLALPTRRGTAFNTALGVGSIYRTSANFALQYGARAEGNAFLTRPDANAVLLQSLGVRTNVTPAAWGISPRLGFRWVYRKRPRNEVIYYSALGRFNREVIGVLRGGIGEFRSFYTPDQVSGAVAATGLAASTLRLLCVGAAIPVDDWESFGSTAASIPSACANGAPALADRTPSVRVLDPAWRAPRSWRSNLNWSTRALGSDLSFEGIASLNLDQAGSIDANFAGAPRFALASEGGRPVFVNASSIVAENGAVSPADARRDPAFGSVLVSQSVARSVSTQFRVTVSPTMPQGTSLRVAYVASRIRARENGFDRNTAGDPRLREWTAGELDSRHQLQVQGSVQVKRVGMSVFFNAVSGTPFTPVVSGDVNGDGFSFNDRAFVTRGGLGATPQFQSAMATLLSSSSNDVRRCLTVALEQIAARNSCRNPWSATMNAQLSSDGRILHLRRRATVTLSLINVLAGIDRAVNGNQLRGWGSRGYADPVLYAVRGWDASARRFIYDVNPRFGNTSPRFSTLRMPFAVTLDVNTPFGPTFGRQQLNRALRNGRNGFPGKRLDSAGVAARYARESQDIYEGILEQRDSLFITAEQLTQLEAARRSLVARSDSVWGALAGYLLSLGDDYQTKEAVRRQTLASIAVWELSRLDAHALDRILTPGQIKLLPFLPTYLRQQKKPINAKDVFID